MAPDSYEVGQLALERQEWAAAVEAFTASLAERAKDPAALFQRGKASYCQGDFWEAAQDFKLAAHLSPDLPGVKLCLRHAQLAVDDDRKAAHQPVWFGLTEAFDTKLDSAWREPTQVDGRVGRLFAVAAVVVLAVGAWLLFRL